MGVPGTVQGSVMLLCASHMANGLIFDKLISVALVTVNDTNSKILIWTCKHQD